MNMYFWYLGAFPMRSELGSFPWFVFKPCAGFIGHINLRRRQRDLAEAGKQGFVAFLFLDGKAAAWIGRGRSGGAWSGSCCGPEPG